MDKPARRIDRISSQYSRVTWLRAAVGAIPHIGGSIDILLTSRHAQIVQQRLELFIDELKKRVESVEEKLIDIEFLESHSGHDLIFTALERVARINDKRRIAATAEIVFKALKDEKNHKVNPIDSVIILGELSEQEAYILGKVYSLYKNHSHLLSGSENKLFTQDALNEILDAKYHLESGMMLKRLEGKGLISSLFEYFQISEYAKQLIEQSNLEYHD